MNNFNECQEQMWRMSKNIEDELYKHLDGFADDIEELRDQRDIIEEKQTKAADSRDTLEDWMLLEEKKNGYSKHFNALERAFNRYDDLYCKYDDKMADIDSQIEELEDSSLYNYFSDCLDIECTISSRFDYLGVEICLAWGGPGIYLNTREKVIKGRWWGDKTDYMIPGDICDAIDDIFEEYYEMQRGCQHDTYIL